MCKSWLSGLYTFPTKSYCYHLISLFASTLPFSLKVHGKDLQKGFETNGRISYFQSEICSKGSGDGALRRLLREERASIMQETNLTQIAYAFLQNTVVASVVYYTRDTRVLMTLQVVSPDSLQVSTSFVVNCLKFKDWVPSWFPETN